MFRRVELFLGISIFDRVCNTYLNSFAVVRQSSQSETDFVEKGRTETIYGSNQPQYCASIVLDVHHEQHVKVEMYERMKEDSELLQHQRLLGSAQMLLSHILSAEKSQFTSEFDLLHEGRGFVSLNTEEIDVQNSENDSIVELELSAAVLRKKDWNRTMLNQRFELHRAHKSAAADKKPLWLPIYRSERTFKHGNSDSAVEFSKTCFSYRHFCNGDERRRLRLSVYGTTKKDSSEIQICSVEFTLRDVCEADPTQEVFQIEGSNEDVEDYGCLCITKAEPTDYGSSFSFYLNYNSTNRFISGSSESNQSSRKHKAKYIVKKLAITRRDRSGRLEVGSEIEYGVNELMESNNRN